MNTKKYVKLFEDLEREGFVEVPSDFDQRLKAAGQMVQRQKESYSKTINQFKSDLFYEIKYAINDYMDYTNGSYATFKEEGISDADIYTAKLHYYIRGVFYKFSEGKFTSIKVEDVPKAKQLLMDMIEKHMPYTKAKYAPHMEVMAMLAEYLKEVVDQGLFNPNAGFVWDEKEETN